MLKKLLVAVVCFTFIICAGLYDRPQFATEDQIVFKHGSADHWLQECFRQATEHCAQYDKKAFFLDNDCTTGYQYEPTANCVSTFECR